VTEPRKPRVLWVGESSFLSSGYSTYARECLKRLHATGRFELLEFGAFGDFDDDRALDLPWKFVSNMPDPRDRGQVERYESSPLNKFGAWKFEEVALDFEPDIVWDYRDWWMCEHQFRSPFRDLFHLAHMPTCDAEPQNDQWVASYLEADAIFGYTDWALDVLRRQTGGAVKAVCAAPPGADAAVFSPFPDRAAFQKAMALPEDAVVVGTVMRNQSRKLYPDLVEAFAKFLAAAPEDLRHRTFLYLHTSYPDTGWDIPKLVRDAGVGHRTIFTYACKACGQAYPAHFQDAIAPCRACGALAAVLPDASKGVSRETLAKVYNLMDVYVQYSTNEGFGMPMVEAAACGVPVLAVDYSAMSDVVRKVAGYPVRVQRYYWESATGRRLALPDNDHLVETLVRVLRRPLTLRRRDGWLARKGVLEHFTYDRTAGLLADHFASVPPRPRAETWGSPNRVLAPNTDVPPGLSHEEWVRWCFAHVVGRPDKADSFAALRMVRDLNWGATTGGMGGVVYNDSSALGLEVESRRQPYDRAKALEAMLSTVGQVNYWEQKREEKNRVYKSEEGR
jgi:glycosyltransferase involved in cell wall biosynthesis